MDDVLNIRDVQATRSHLRRDHHAVFVLLEVFEVLQPLFLFHFAMQHNRRDVEVTQHRSTTLDTFDGVAEHDGATGIVDENVVKMEVFLIKFTKNSGLDELCSNA